MRSFNDDMHKESFYQFILYTLLREGKSNILFKTEAMLLGKQRASTRYFSKLFQGCDVPSFLHIQNLFNKEHPQCRFEMNEFNIDTDSHGLMTGHIGNCSAYQVER